MPALCGMEDQELSDPLGHPEEFEEGGSFCGDPYSNGIYQNKARYTPSGQALRVRANFIVLQRQDGTGNFQDIPEHRAFLDEWVDFCNETLANTWWSNNSNCQPSASDALVEIVPNWIFLPDPTEYNWDYNNHNTSFGCPNQNNWWLNGLDAQINSDPDIPKGINVYFTIDADIYHQLVTLQTINNPQAAGMHYTWCSEHPTLTDLEQPSRINVVNMFLKYYWFKNNLIGQYQEPFSVTRNWLVSDGRILAHEFGHSFIREYVHFSGCTDHLMAPGPTPGTGRAMRIEDLQNIHRGFVFNNIRQFIDCDSRYNASMYSNDREWSINTDEEWILDMRLYHNLRVTAGTTLTIRCKLLLPEDGVVIVERGGRLIVDGGQIWRANTCDANQHWAGIAVNGNPALAQPDPNAALNSNQAGVVLLMGDGEIEGAVIGVAAQEHPHWDTPQMRGGLIQGTSFTFRDNIRGVQFNRYDLPNLSKFENVTFINENGNAKWGTTMWRTNSIFFEGCTFKDLIRSGIVSWDASYVITKRNKFLNCVNTGVDAGASMPLLGLIKVGNHSQLSNERNKFKDNGVGILARANSMTQIFKNDLENFDFDVAVNGFAHNQIQGNVLRGDAAGVQLESTSVGINYLQCNTYQTNIVGLNIVGNNANTTFYGEEFATQVHDLFIEGTSTNPGAIQQSQGSQGNATWNYFTDNQPEQIKTSTVSGWNNTDLFYYYHPDPSGNARLEPHCALNDQTCTGPSNFENYQTTGIELPCSGAFFNGDEPCEGRPCLDSLRDFIYTLENTYSLMPGDSMYGLWQQMVFKRERTIVNWLGDYIENEEWTSAIELLTSDANPYNQRRHVAIRLMRDEFSLADSLLQAFPQQNIEDQQFVQVQRINLEFLSDSTFFLDSLQEVSLMNIAISGTSQAGYAQTLLSLLADVTIMPRLPILDEEAEPRQELTNDNAQRKGHKLSISPNPGRDQITIMWQSPDKITNWEAYHLVITNAVTGQMLGNHFIYSGKATSLDTSLWPAGMYHLAVRDQHTGQIKESQNVVIQH